MAESERFARAVQVVARGLARIGRERARRTEVTPQQAETLLFIAEKGAVSTSHMAVVLGIDPSTASRNLAGLEKPAMSLAARARTTAARRTSASLRGASASPTARALWPSRRSPTCSRSSRAASARRSPTGWSSLDARSTASRCDVPTRDVLSGSVPRDARAQLARAQRPSGGGVERGPRFTCVAKPPLRPASRASSGVNSCAVPAR